MNTKAFRKGAAAARADIESLLARGRALLDKGLLAPAFSLIQMAYGDSPDDPDVLYWMGVAYFALGQVAVGLHTLRSAVARRPGEALYRTGLAQALAGTGQLEEAEKQQASACALRPADAESHGALGVLQSRLEHFDAAERSYEAAAALQPDHAAWHESLALLQYRRWAIPETLASVARARELTGTQLAQRMNIGFAQPVAHEPRDPPAHLLRAAPERPPSQRVQDCEVRDLLVFDDFLPDPWTFRDEVLRLCARAGGRHAEANFPGVQTAALPCDGTMQRIANALGRRLKWDSLDQGAVRVSVATDDARADVHVDNATLPEIFGGVLYLSLPRDCRGGTSFYRHRATGWEGRPDDATMRAGGYPSFPAFQKRHLPANQRLPFADWQRRREAVWQWLFEVPMKFNRLIVFRANFFHAVTELFGDRPENGRLIQLFHFEGERQPGAASRVAGA